MVKNGSSLWTLFSRVFCLFGSFIRGSVVGFNRKHVLIPICGGLVEEMGNKIFSVIPGN